MNEADTLFKKIEERLAEQNILIIRYCGSLWQERFIAGLTQGRKVFDFADPLLQSRLLLQPDDVAAEFSGSIVFYNLHNIGDRIKDLLAAVPQESSCLIVTRQSFFLEAVRELELLDLPLNADVTAANLVTLGETDWTRLAEKEACDVYDCILKGALFGYAVENAAAYLKRFLAFDVKELTAVNDSMRFYKFMCFIAANSGSVVNYAQISKAADISSPTAKQWLRYLEGAGLAVLLPSLENVGGKRLTKAPKVYFRDTALACCLLHIDSREALINSNLVNNLFETWVVMRLREGYLQKGEQPQMQYYRDSNAKEIGLLLQNDRVLYPVEIKREPVNLRRMQKKFAAFEQLLAENGTVMGAGGVIGSFKQLEQAEGIWCIPAGLL